MAKSNNLEERLERIERMVVLASKDVLDVSECAMLLNRSESRIRHMVSERLLPYYKAGGRTLFRKSEIEAHLLKRENRVPTMEEIESRAATRVALRTSKNQRNEKGNSKTNLVGQL